ncbi:MAG: YdcF family protein [Gammaproteobacteria bacterium]|nr:YdcF family protein [Gammaproteobacteria bacterium]MDH5799580.1 YdcF family protein [Gammaproteobacteria bacterium]
MELGLLKFLQNILTPPTCFILSALLGVVLYRFRPLWSIRLLLLSSGLLYLFSLPVTAVFLAGLLEPPALPPSQLHQTPAQAIVVLSASRYENNPEYGADVSNGVAAQRLRYTAWLQRQTGLPVLISGGKVNANHRESEARLMQQMLEQEFGVAVQIIEERSRTTYENARYSSELLLAKKYRHILLVSHALHLPRARVAFEHFGIGVTPAPTLLHSRERPRNVSHYLLPKIRALQITEYFFHEWLGGIWYRLRYY